MLSIGKNRTRQNNLGIALIFLLLTSCNKDRIESIQIDSEEIKFFIERFAFEHNTNLVLMVIVNYRDSTEILLEEFESTHDLRSGDEFGYLVDHKWKNVTAPMFKTRINSIDVYIETGIEKIAKSRSRYKRLLNEVKGRIYYSVESYNREDDSFIVNPPATSLVMPWKMVIDYDRTHMKTYISRREGYDDFYYQIEETRIDSNYQERYD